MKKLIYFFLLLFIFNSSVSIAALVSGTTAHQHDSATGGGSTISSKLFTGDYSNTTHSSRVKFQTSTTNGFTSISVVPNGTNNTSRLTLYGSSDPDNASAIVIDVNGSFTSTSTGTGVAPTSFSYNKDLHVTGLITTEGPGGSLSIEPRDGTGTSFQVYNPTGDELFIYGVNGPGNLIGISNNGTLRSIKACATGYTRITPNYCNRNAGAAFVALARDFCTTINPGISDAKALVLLVEMTTQTANAVASRFVTVQNFSENTCVNVHEVLKNQSYEEVAKVTSVLSSSTGKMLAPGNIAYLKYIDDAGNDGQASYYIAGYYD